MNRLEKTLKYEFNNKDYLKLALTHSSYANEHKTKKADYNERLEFLGDSVLGLVVAEYLYSSFSELPEGELTKIRAGVVCEQALYYYAKQIGLGQELLLGKGEERTNGRERPSVLADAFEALVAAIYLDGGWDAVKKIILPMFERGITLASAGKINRDYKTALQEIVQKNKQETLSYVLKGQQGPDHDKQFFVDLLLNSNAIAQGCGKSKKEAEQDAAKHALELMGEQ